MVKVIRNLFTPEICKELVEMTSDLSETFISFQGVEARRKILSDRRSPIPFFLHQLSKEESRKYCDIIQEALPNTHATSFRIMNYPTGSCIRDHVDTWQAMDGESNSGLIVQLVDPASYKGGFLSIENEFIDLKLGDAVYYSYDCVHGVKTIKEGERWILNVRMMTES